MIECPVQVGDGFKKTVLIGGWVGGVSYIHFFGMFLTLQIPFHSMW